MANPEHLKVLNQGVNSWNKWREDNPDVRPDLSGADLTEADLTQADLSVADLYRAKLTRAKLTRAKLTEADLAGAALAGAALTGADLTGADLSRAELSGAVFNGAKLTKAALIRALLDATNLIGAVLVEADLGGANLSGATLTRADLFLADLRGANLTGADLTRAGLLETELTNADLSGCRIHGISAWRLVLHETKQDDLVITHPDEPVVTVDNIEVAQFVYLLLHSPKIRDVISTIGNKGVLILGRFTEDRKSILDALRVALRSRNYVPIVFDFEGAEERDLTETVLTLAGMSKFVIADITRPRSVPHELAVLLPNYMIPFKPILQKGEKPYAMFADYRKRFEKWVLPRLEYRNKDQLVAVLGDAIIQQVEEKHRQLLIDKEREDVAEDADDYERGR